MCLLDEIFVTDCTESPQNVNFPCSQWWKFRQNGDIYLWTKLCLYFYELHYIPYILYIHSTEPVFAAKLLETAGSVEDLAFLRTPDVISVTSPKCLSFRYFMASNLELKSTSPNETKVLMDLEVDGGDTYHLALVDLPYGEYQLLWEVRADVVKFDRIAKYRAAIYDIRYSDSHCSALREYWRHHKWNGNVIILTKFASLLPEVVKVKTFYAASCETFVKMRKFLFQCLIVFYPWSPSVLMTIIVVPSVKTFSRGYHYFSRFQCQTELLWDEKQCHDKYHCFCLKWPCLANYYSF